jgi:hypothetical protein
MSKSGEDVEYRFADDAAASRAASVLRLVADEGAASRAARGRLVVEGPVPAGPPPGPRAPRSLARVRELWDGSSGWLENVRQDGLHVVFEAWTHDDLDVWAEGDRSAPTTAKLRKALERLVADLGGVSRQDAEERDRLQERSAQLAAAPSATELLLALEAALPDLLRYERVFVDSLRTSVAAGVPLEGQRVEAMKILARVETARKAAK